MLLAWLVERCGGRLALYDVFERIPAPSEIDGERARDRYLRIVHEEDQAYYGNLPNLLTLIRTELSRVCSIEKMRFVQGRYEDVLPAEHCDPYDLVHIDCDWYASVKSVLSFLETHLSSDAMVQVDDYSNWEGSRMAVDETEWLTPYRRHIVGGPLVIDLGRPCE